MSDERLAAERLLAASPVAMQTYDRVHALLVGPFPDVAVRVTRSQVAFRRRRGFAFLWRPDQYLHGEHAPVVLSVALNHRLTSERFKEVVHPGPWMHHLEVRSADEVDDEVGGWLLEAAEQAG